MSYISLLACNLLDKYIPLLLYKIFNTNAGLFKIVVCFSSIFSNVLISSRGCFQFTVFSFFFFSEGFCLPALSPLGGAFSSLKIGYSDFSHCFLVYSYI